MAQAIYFCNNEGLVLASDSLVVRELAGGRTERLTLRRLYPLGSHVALLAGASPVGVELAERLAHWLEPRGRLEFEDVVALSRDFMAEGYARHLRGAPGPADAHLHFLIAGYASRGSSRCQALLWQSEAGELPFQELRLGHVFTLPRRMVQEARITRQIAEGLSLRELAERCRASMAHSAEQNPEGVGGPFHVAMITARGIQFLDESQEA